MLPLEGQKAAVKVTMVQRNKPAQLVFLIPTELPTGDYALEVRSRISKSHDLRIGRLDAILSV